MGGRGFTQRLERSVNYLNYRPIALTSHLCKLMEKMITDRLMYNMEKNNFFSPYQSGFRRGRGTMDSIIKLESDNKPFHTVIPVNCHKITGTTLPVNSKMCCSHR